MTGACCTKSTCDDLAGFVEWVIVSDPDASIKGSVLYVTYRDWASREGVNAWSARAVNEAVVERMDGVAKVKSALGLSSLNIDLKKTYRPHYTAGDEVDIVDVPVRPYLMIDGEGDPNTSQAYADAVATLYPLAYALRKAIKEASGTAYTVMPLEGLWWADDMSAFRTGDRSVWRWTAMICQPEKVSEVPSDEVIREAIDRKDLPAGGLERIESFGDGPAAQILHVGPYSEEGPIIARLHEFIDSQGLHLVGRHHEIYLSDPRRTEPAKNRTIIRQPVTRTA